MFKARKQKSRKEQQHEKLEESRDTTEEMTDGVTFTCKLLGDKQVVEVNLEEGESYVKVAAKAVHSMMGATKEKNLSSVAVIVTKRGLFVHDSASNAYMYKCSVFRICYCCQDTKHPRVFAVVVRLKPEETFHCLAFLCDKAKLADSMAFTVGRSFQAAKEEYDRKQEEKFNKSITESPDNDSSLESDRLSSPIQPQIPSHISAAQPQTHGTSATQPQTASSAVESLPVQLIVTDDVTNGVTPDHSVQVQDQVSDDDDFELFARDRVVSPAVTSPSSQPETTSSKPEDSFESRIRASINASL